MSQIIEYFRSLFTRNNNNTRKRRRAEFNLEEREPFPKYKKVTNYFPKTYTKSLIDDDTDLFQEVKQNTHLYNELLEDYLMDQQRKHFKAVLDDGEFSDEEERTQRKPPSNLLRTQTTGYDFQRFYSQSQYQRQQQQQPSTSTNTIIRKSQLFTNGNASKDEEDDDDVQFVSYSHKPALSKITQRPRQEMPSLIPIKSFAKVTTFPMTNGHSSEKSSNYSTPKPISSQQSQQQTVQKRRSILDFQKKNKAFESTSPKTVPTNSIIFHNRNKSVKSQYDDLIKSLIPRFSNAAIEKNRTDNAKSLETIDLSNDDGENIVKNNSVQSSHLSSSYNNYNNTSYTGRQSDFRFKKPTEFVDLSDDEIDQTKFVHSPGFSSTQIIKSNDIGRIRERNSDKIAQSQTFILPPVNTLKEKHSTRSALKEDSINSIVEKFYQKRVEANKTIEEEEKNATKLAEERIQYERVQQRRIDDSITAALVDKCVIIDEGEEEVVDEFPPLNEQQLRIVSFALHGRRDEVIISKFNMNITRHDTMTLDGLNWLNDEVINFYMELIKERSEQMEHLPKVHVMNTFFLGKLLQNGHASVRRWTRKVDIFSFDIIPIPVHVGGVHWCMSIIHFKNKTIRYYDSMGHPNYVVLEALKNYLKEESLDKRKIPFDMTDWSLECIRDCPQQKNGSDCGVFSCQFAEFISRDSSISFEQQHMQYFRRKMICEISTGKLLLG